MRTEQNIIDNQEELNKLFLTTENKKVWVTMTDKFLSHWGKADGKINKYIVECENYEQAQTIKRNAELRSEMKYISICVTKPYFNSKRYLESNVKFKDLGEIWTK